MLSLLLLDSTDWPCLVSAFAYHFVHLCKDNLSWPACFHASKKRDGRFYAPLNSFGLNIEIAPPSSHIFHTRYLKLSYLAEHPSVVEFGSFLPQPPPPPPEKARSSLSVSSSSPPSNDNNNLMNGVGADEGDNDDSLEIDEGKEVRITCIWNKLQVGQFCGCWFDSLDKFRKGHC